MEQNDLIKKWLQDDLNAQEREAFEALDDFELNHAIIKKAKDFKASNFSEVPTFQSLEQRLDNTKEVYRINWYKPLLRIASVIVIAFGIYFTFFNKSLTEINTIAGEKATIQLPDNSEVIINALSSLSYNKDQWNEDRKVSLEGEAFFKVAKGKKFDVVTDDGIVSVLGTQFNVKYRQDYFEVKCYEGIVQVKTKKVTKRLKVGETIRVYDGLLSFSTTEDAQPQWTNNLSTFKSVPFYQVLKELERQYGIKVNYTGDKQQQLFSGAFSHNNLENALISVSRPLKLMYKIESSNTVSLFKSEN